MKNALKIIFAILMVVLMIPTMGTVYIKDNQNRPEYCASCHEDPYYSQWASPTGEYIGAYQHSQMGVSCQNCHQRSVVEGITEVIEYFEEDGDFRLRESNLPSTACFRCHTNYTELALRTADYEMEFEIAPQFLEKLSEQNEYDPDENTNVNPHGWAVDANNPDGPHAEGGEMPECYRCHKMHRESPGMDYCFTCHHSGTFAPCLTCHDE
jgi:hypothetical protein